MRIAIVSDTYLPQINGVVTAVQLLRRELQRVGHEVFVIAPSYGRRESPEPGVYRYRSVPFPTEATRENRFAFRLSAGPRFDWERARIDVIHSQVEASMGSHALHWARRHKIPHVHTYHTLWQKYVHYAGVLAPPFARWVRWRTRTFCNSCDRVIAPSQALRRAILGDGVTVPVEVIPTGMDSRAGRQVRAGAAVRRELGIPEGRRVLALVGRIAPEKGIGFLLLVLERLLQAGVDVQFVVVGDGPGRGRLAEQARSMGLAGRVSFTGYVPRERTFDYTALADLFVFSSETETQGIALLEAMSGGTPVVAVSAMGVAELMADGRGGIAVTPGDLAGFVRAVKTLLDDHELRATRAEEARLKAADWAIEATTQRVIACYRRAIADYAGKRR
jgi:glycosyltransferase involved in cell wall biosynthesis